MPQTAEYPTTIAPVIPKQYYTGKNSRLDRLEATVLGLMGEIGSANRAKAKAIIKDLQALSGMVGRAGSHASKLQATISSGIARAQRKTEEQEPEEIRVEVLDADRNFEGAVYILMSYEVRQFYNAINPDAIYKLAPVNENGELVFNAAQNVDGKKLRRLMSLVKFHGLDTESKKKILLASYGSDAAAGEGTPKNKAQLAKKKMELHALHEALDLMEAYKAHLTTRRYTEDMAMEMIARNHEAVVQMHGQIDEVMRRYDHLINDIDNSMAMATLKVAKLKMKQMLNNDFVGHVLLEKPISPAVSGGIGVTRLASTATSALGFDALAQSFRPQAESV